jgi:hypothetical protein
MMQILRFIYYVHLCSCIVIYKYIVQILCLYTICKDYACKHNMYFDIYTKYMLSFIQHKCTISLYKKFQIDSWVIHVEGISVFSVCT